MSKRLILLLAIFFWTMLAQSQTFRIARPVEDKYQIHGGYLYAEDLFGYPHKGIDFPVPEGTHVYSATDGVVDVKAYEANGAGYYVVIKSRWEGRDIWLYYMHLSDYSGIQVGDTVGVGDVLALSGNTGNSTGPHLHFEIRQGSKSFNAYMNRRNPELWMSMAAMGAVCGRVPNAPNGTRVDVDPDPKPRPPYTTYGYSLTYTFDGRIGIDDIYQENFAIGEMKPGTYTITSINGYRRTVTVKAGEVINLDPPTAIEETETIPREYLIVKSYPNPFNQESTIVLHLAERGAAGVGIYDTSGKRVDFIDLGMLGPGRHQAVWNARRQASGLYFAHVRAGMESRTLKMILVK